jgi:colicin import membrane protein
VLNNNPSLGVASGTSAMLSQSELDALRARLRDCWNPPVGAANDPRLFVVLRVFFKKDGSMAREPVPIEGTPSASGPALAESAKRALLRCQPFTMLRPDHYEKWKDIEIKFDMQDMLRG